MGDPDEAPDLRVGELFAALVRCHVRFVVVGGVGSQLHGATRVTKDLDVCPEWGQENFERLREALEDLGARLRLAPEVGDVQVLPNVKLLREFPITRWRTRAGDVDVIVAIPGAGGRPVGFRELEPRAVVVRVVDAAIIVAALEDIVRSKEQANRPKDREAHTGETQSGERQSPQGRKLSTDEAQQTYSGRLRGQHEAPFRGPTLGL